MDSKCRVYSNTKDFLHFLVNYGPIYNEVSAMCPFIPP